MGVAVDLAFAREHECPSEARLCVGGALVDVNRNHTDRADLAGLGHVEPIGSAGDRICRRQRAFVCDRPEWLIGTGLDRTYLVDEVEQAADLAAGRVDVEDDAAHRRIVHGGRDGVADVSVGQQTACGIEISRAGDQRADHRNHCDPLHRDRGRRRGIDVAGSRGSNGPPANRGASTPRITSSLARAIISGVPNTRDATCGRSNIALVNPCG